jgi:hypothetical protein
LLRQDVETLLHASLTVTYWPPAFKEWSTKSVRDAFFASPQFPRLTNPDALKETISRGVGNGLLAYVGKTPSNEYKPFYFSQALMTADVELSDEMFIITKETAQAFLKERVTPPTPGTELPPAVPTPPIVVPAAGIGQPPSTTPSAAFGLTWTGEIPPMKWMNFYTNSFEVRFHPRIKAHLEDRSRARRRRLPAEARRNEFSASRVGT